MLGARTLAVLVLLGGCGVARAQAEPRLADLRVELRDLVRDPCRRASSATQYATARNRLLIQMHVARLNDELAEDSALGRADLGKGAWLVAADRRALELKQNLLNALRQRLASLPAHAVLAPDLGSLFSDPISRARVVDLSGPWERACVSIAGGLGPDDRVSETFQTPREFLAMLRNWRSGSVDEAARATPLGRLWRLPEKAERDHADHSGLFPGVVLQGDAKSCVAHAMAADAEAFPDIRGRVDVEAVHRLYVGTQRRLQAERAPFDPELTPTGHYARSSEIWSIDESVGTAFRSALARARTVAPATPEVFASGVFSLLSNFLFLDADIPSTASAGQRVRIKRFVQQTALNRRATGKPEDGDPLADLNYLRALVDAAGYVQVAIDHDGREARGGWMRPKRPGMGHAMLVVGYGIGVSPFDLRTQPYFIARDSLATEPIHYRVSAWDLLPMIAEYGRILELTSIAEDK